MTYERLADEGVTVEQERLYALGIDAFRVALHLANHKQDAQPLQTLQIDGVTGQLMPLGKTAFRTWYGALGERMVWRQLMPARVVDGRVESVINKKQIGF
jgi:hypothetical protein